MSLINRFFSDEWNLALQKKTALRTKHVGREAYFFVDPIRIARASFHARSFPPNTGVYMKHLQTTGAPMIPECDQHAKVYCYPVWVAQWRLRRDVAFAQRPLGRFESFRTHFFRYAQKHARSAACSSHCTAHMCSINTEKRLKSLKMRFTPQK